MVNKLAIIAIAISIIIGLIGVATLYSGDLESNENGEVVTPEPKKFTVDLEENVGLVAP